MVFVALIIGYLLGTFPSADLVTRIATRGTVDIRQVGSGNPGTLNAIQSIGTRWGIIVLILDIAKGVGAGFFGRWVAGPNGAYLAATASIAGHIFPVWTRFRGGKGVATSAGACIAVFPIYVPLDFVVAFLGAARSRRATLSTRIAGGVWVVAAVLWTIFDWPNLWGPPAGPGLIGFSVVGTSMILWAFWDAERRPSAPPA